MELRSARPDEGRILYDLAESAGWNQSLDECRFLVSAPFLDLVFLTDGDRIAGSAGAVVYGNRELIFLNMVVVRDEYRRHGCATRMVEHFLTKYADAPTFRLHATADGAKVYEKMGFQTRRTVCGYKAPSPDFSFLSTTGIRPAGTSDLPAVAAFDQRQFGFDRTGLFSFLLNGTTGPAAVDTAGHGFAFGRTGRKNRTLSVVEAEDPETALRLAAAVAASAPDMPFSTMCYDGAATETFRAGLERAGFVRSREMPDMEYGRPGPVPGRGYYATCGGDLG